ncbi:MAG: porin [Desulfurivibrionaceae bacterium]
MKSIKRIRIPVTIALGALCLGGTGTAAAQEMANSIYGNFRFSYNYVDEADSTLRADNNASRLGFKGEIKGDLLTAFYHLESGANNDAEGSAFTSRFYYGGVKGQFGSVTVGRHSTAYKMAGLALDPFYDLAHVGPAVGPDGSIFAASGATYGTSALTNGWANNTLAYSSPEFVGLKLNAAAYFDDSEEDNHDFAAGLTYAIGPFGVGVQYHAVDDHTVGGSVAPWAGKVDELDAYRVHGSFDSGPFKIGASYEKLDYDADTSEDVDYIYVSATYAVLPTTRLALSVGDVSDGDAEGTGGNVGIFHDLFKNTTVYGLYSMVDLDSAGAEDVDIVSLGFIYDFNMSL